MSAPSLRPCFPRPVISRCQQTSVQQHTLLCRKSTRQTPTMRPILLGGHERSLTFVKYNREGDLLFSASKDNTPAVWYSATGERLGTYNGHGGTVWHLDVNYDTTLLLTGSADNTAKLWHVESGKQLFSFHHGTPVRCVGFQEGDRGFLTVRENRMGYSAAILLWELGNSPSEQSQTPQGEITVQDMKVTHALWGALNKTIIASTDEGDIQLYDTEEGVLVNEIKPHEESINSIAWAFDKQCFITASADHTAKLFDTRTMKVVKTYTTGRPVNSAVVSPILDHVLVGGGQRAADVTTTSTRVGKFDAKVYDLVFEEQLASIKGHFGPINTLAYHPDGKSYASGGEDGYVRLHALDDEYFDLKSDLPPPAPPASATAETSA